MDTIYCLNSLVYYLLLNLLNQKDICIHVMAMTFHAIRMNRDFKKEAKAP